MKYVFVSYNYSPDFDTPESWYKRTEAHSGILDFLAKDNTVINIKQINYEGDCVNNGVQYKFVNFGKKKVPFARKINHYVKKLNPDVVVVHGLHFPLQVIHLRLSIAKKIKIIGQNHAEKPFTGIKKYIQRIADKCIDAYLFPTYTMGMDWIALGNISTPGKVNELMEVSSIFYPVKKSLALEKTGVTGNPVFLWVLRLNPVKDPLTVVRAFLRFVEFNPSARLYMIYHTDDLLPQVKELLYKSPNKNAVTLVGKVLHDELLYWYNSADIFVSGSHYEGSNTALCEAMSCGCMPLVTDIPSLRMMTDDGKCGVVYQPGNEEELLAAFIKTPNMDVAEKQARSIAYFQKKLSFEAIAKEIHRIASSL